MAPPTSGRRPRTRQHPDGLSDDLRPANLSRSPSPSSYLNIDPTDVANENEVPDDYINFHCRFLRSYLN